MMIKRNFLKDFNEYMQSDKITFLTYIIYSVGRFKFLPIMLLSIALNNMLILF